MRRILGKVASINVRKVLWTADELGLTYEREDWGMPLRDPKVPEFLALNPNGLVPVLVEDGFVLWESTAIMGYFADGAARTGLVPQDPRARGLMAQWLGWQAADLAPVWGYAFLALARRVPGHDDPARIAQSIAAWGSKMAILEAQMQDGRPHVTGADFTLADIALGLAVHRWFATPFAKPDLPRLAAYLERLRARPAARAWLGAETP